MKFLFFSFLIILSFSSCSDNCIKCQRTEIDNTISVMEFCDDGETNFTDQFGNIITFDEVILKQEGFGFDCN